MSALPESFLGGAANDADSQETREWLDALAAVIEGMEVKVVSRDGKAVLAPPVAP